MDVPQIKDREHLEAWLKTRSREECIAIAHRAAMRVAPLWIGQVNFTLGSPVPYLADVFFFRCCLISWAAACQQATDVVLPMTDINRAVRNTFSEANVAIKFVDTATAAVNFSAESAFFAVVAATTVFIGNSVAAAIDAVVGTADAPDVVEKVWEPFWQDLYDTQSGIATAILPLWQRKMNPFAAEWARARADLVARGSDWDFWVRWYDAALRGQPLNWKMQEEIALIPSEVWEGDVAGLAAAIAAIELKHAIEATQNGETVAINPQTGKLFLAPDTELPADIATYANRKLAKAIALFGESPANQYTALAPELNLLAETLADANNLPVEIFDACASVSRRVTARAENGECPKPEKDALIADFLIRVREVGADILGNDPKTQQILFKRHSLRANASLVKARPVILTAAGMISEASEGFLAKAIVANANEASNPNSDPETRSLSAWKLASRVFRMRNIVVSAIALSPANLALQTQGLHYLVYSPEFSKLMALLFSHFGF